MGRGIGGCSESGGVLVYLLPLECEIQQAESFVLFTAASPEFGMMPGNRRCSVNHCCVDE